MQFKRANVDYCLPLPLQKWEIFMVAIETGMNKSNVFARPEHKLVAETF